MTLMTPSEALVEQLVAEGITNIFGIVGSAFMDALDLFPDAGIRFIPVAHEQAAAHAADGYARVTGKPQACIAQNGPGGANFISAVTAAFWAHSPVVAITPETGSMGIGTGGFQELDQMPWFQKCTKYQVRVNRPERMAELTRRCFYEAKVHSGPVQLNIPRDYFYGDINTEIFPSRDVSYGSGPVDQIEKAANLLAKAKYPVILAGGGVSSSNAIEITKKLAEYLTAPVVNTYLHNDSFPQNHDLGVGPIGYCGSKAAMYTIQKADVVLALGTRLGPFGTLPQYDIDYWPKDATLIQVDIDATQLGLSKAVELGIMADAKQYAEQLLIAIKSADKDRKKNSARLEEIKKVKMEWAEELGGWSSSTSKLMHPRRFIKELTDAMPDGSIVSTDIGNNSSICNAYLTFSGVRQHISALSWGNCGFAYGAAMGAKMGAFDKPVFALQGDGAYGISGLAEVMTSVRENIPIIAVVFHNKEWGAEKKNQIDFFDNRFVGCDLPTNPDYAQIARDMGAEGYKVDDYKDVREIVNTAVKSGKPTVINAIIEGGENVLAEPFRRDAFKPAVRHLPKYKHLDMTSK